MEIIVGLIAAYLLAEKVYSSTFGYSYDANESLRIALEKNDFATAEIALKDGHFFKGADINERPHGSKDHAGSHLDTAAANGELEKIKFLIKNGVDVNSKNGNGLTALHLAAYNGKIEAMQLLIEAGANINAESEFGTPLHYAAKSYNEPLLASKILIENGADINTKDKDGNSPINGFINQTYHYENSNQVIEAVTLAKFFIANKAEVTAEQKTHLEKLGMVIPQTEPIQIQEIKEVVNYAHEEEFPNEFMPSIELHTAEAPTEVQ